MKKLAKARIVLSGINATDLVVRGRLHVKSCTGNADVVLPPDFLFQLAAACDALERANIAVRDNGGRQDTLVRAARVWDVKQQIRSLAALVEAYCGGNGEKIAGTGFDLHRQPQPVGILDAPQELRAQRGALAGEVKLRWKGVEGRLIYALEMNAGDLTDLKAWREVARTGRNYHTVTDLETDKIYSFRVRAISSAGDGVLSEVKMSKAA